MSELTITEPTTDREIVITRVIDAPRDLVFEAWTNLQHLEKWWGPDGFTTTSSEFSFKEGGVWRHVMHGPDGVDYPSMIAYEEIVSSERIVYSQGSGNEALNDAQFRATITFEDIGGKTKLTQRSLFRTAAERELVVTKYHAIEGGNQHVARLAEFVKATPVIVEHTYNAPIEKVWKAISDKDEMSKWYLDLKEFKPEVGFEFQFEGGGEDGAKYLHLCKITEVIPEKKLAYTWRFEGLPGNSLVTFELFSAAQQTTLRLTHSGLETFMPEQNPDMSRENFLGWNHLIGISLKKFIENK